MSSKTQQLKTSKTPSFAKASEGKPKLRFPGFSGGWEEKKLGDISDYKNGGAFENNLVENGKYNLITLNSICKVPISLDTFSAVF